VNLEELICSLRKTRKLRKNNLKQKEKLQKYEEEDRDSKSKMSQILEESENIIISLKFQLEEETRIEEVVRIQLKEKEEKCENLEDELISLRKDLENSTTELNGSLKFENSFKTLDHIINFQRSQFIKMVLGYDKSQMTTKEDPKVAKPSKKVNEEKYEIYANVIKSSISDDDNMKKENNVSLKVGISAKENKDRFKIYFPPRWTHMNWYQNSFSGCFFCCKHFGNKAIYCRTHKINNHVWNKYMNYYGFPNINYNSFSRSLLDYNALRYK
jgi:hypothetical protein